MPSGEPPNATANALADALPNTPLAPAARAGFETPILQGGEALFKKYNVWFILAECNKDIIKEEGQKEFLK